MKKKNSDREEPNPWRNRNFPAEYVDMIHGEGGEVFPRYVPSHHELIQLVKYWAVIMIHSECCVLWQRSNRVKRLWHAACCQLVRIAELLGYDEIINNVYEEYGVDKDSRLWNEYRKGYEDGKRAAKEEIQRRSEKPE